MASLCGLGCFKHFRKAALLENCLEKYFITTTDKRFKKWYVLQRVCGLLIAAMETIWLREMYRKINTGADQIYIYNTSVIQSSLHVIVFKKNSNNKPFFVSFLSIGEVTEDKEADNI